MLKIDERAAIDAAMLNFHGTVQRGKTRRAYGATIPRSTGQDAPGISVHDYINSRHDLEAGIPAVAFDQSSRKAREAYYR